MFCKNYHRTEIKFFRSENKNCFFQSLIDMKIDITIFVCSLIQYASANLLQLYALDRICHDCYSKKILFGKLNRNYH